MAQSSIPRKRSSLSSERPKERNFAHEITGALFGSFILLHAAVNSLSVIGGGASGGGMGGEGSERGEKMRGVKG